jgi:hypothetical protein
MLDTKGGSSIGRAPVSKTGGCRFDSCPPCCTTPFVGRGSPTAPITRRRLFLLMCIRRVKAARPGWGFVDRECNRCMHRPSCNTPRQCELHPPNEGSRESDRSDQVEIVPTAPGSIRAELKQSSSPSGNQPADRNLERTKLTHASGRRSTKDVSHARKRVRARNDYSLTPSAEGVSMTPKGDSLSP